MQAQDGLLSCEGAGLVPVGLRVFAHPALGELAERRGRYFLLALEAVLRQEGMPRLGPALPRARGLQGLREVSPLAQGAFWPNGENVIAGLPIPRRLDSEGHGRSRSH